MSILWAIAFGICPQRPGHSLFLGGQQMPIEARMAGMFGGFVLAAAYGWAAGRGRALRLPGREVDVTAALQNPAEIRQSKSDAAVYLFYTIERVGRWVCAVASSRPIQPML